MASLQRPIRLALIGCGEVTRAKHLPALQNVSEVSVSALCDLDPDRSRRLAQSFGIQKYCASADEIFALPDVEAVGVCSDPGSHAGLAVGAMREGKHVLVEKPLALSTADCVRMIDAAQSTGLIAMTGFHMRFHRLVRQARESIQQGGLGPIEYARVVWNSPRGDDGTPEWKMRRKTGGGALVEIAVHHLDLLRFLFGTEFEQIHALSRDGVRDDEAAVLTARMENGTLVSGAFSERSPHALEVEVSGHGGWLRINCQKFDGLEIRRPREVPGSPPVRLRSLTGFFRSLPFGLTTLRRGGDYRMSYEHAWRHFAQCVRNGNQPEVTLQDGLRATQAFNAALESASTGRPVSIRKTEQPVE